MLILFALLSGTVCGVIWATISPVSLDTKGMKLLQSALSIVSSVSVVSITFVEVAALELRTSTGNNTYLHTQLFVGLMFVSAAVCLWLLRACKIHECLGRGGNGTSSMGI